LKEKEILGERGRQEKERARERERAERAERELRDGGDRPRVDDVSLAAANTQPCAPEFKYTLATKLGNVCVHGCRADGICGVETGWYGTDCCACAPANFDYEAGFQGQNVHKNTCMDGTDIQAPVQAPDDQDSPLPGEHPPGFQCQESWNICRCHANRGKCEGFVYDEPS